MQAPGFAATALLTLAIGIGANAAVFTLIHGVLLKSLPVADPAALFKLGDEYNCCVQGSFQNNWSMFPYPFYVELRDSVAAFDQLAAAQTNRPSLSVRRSGWDAVAESLRGELVSGNYFATFGLGASAGRLISPPDDAPAAPPVAVVSYRTWQERYGSDPSIVGSTLTVNGLPVTVVGIAPPGFFGDRLDAYPPELWMPLAIEPTLARENSLLRAQTTSWLYVIGRLRPGANPSQVQAQLTTALRQYLSTPGNTSSHQDRSRLEKQQIRLSPGGSGINAMKDDFEEGLLLLMAASAAVLLIACANLANLLLARGTTTRVRTALQIAMGASRARIVRSHVTESVVLALAGGALGLLLSRYATRAMLLLVFRGSDAVPISTTPSAAVLAFTFLVALATGVVFGAGPAWMASRADPADALRGAGRMVRDASALPQKTLVVVQAAVSVVLIAVAGLLTQSLRNLQNQSYGFEKQGRLLVEISPQAAGYTQERLRGLYERMHDRLVSVPGVVSASLALYTAQQGNNWGEEVFVPGRARGLESSWDRVSAGYFETLGTPVVRGRGIEEQDTAAARKVAVVNEAFVRRFFPDQDPIGQHFGKDAASHASDYEIVGVVKDAKYGDAARVVHPMFFVPLSQKVTYELEVDTRVEDASMYMGTIVLRVQADPNTVVAGVRRGLGEVDPNLTPISMRTMEDQMRIQDGERTLIAGLTDLFGIVALLLASIGLYGVTAYRVARRTGEVGLRMALGAARADVLWLVLRGAFAQVGLGLLIGVPLAFLARRGLEHQLFGIGAFDARSLTVAVATLAACAFVASVLPARRAAAIDPMRALRTE